MENEDQKEVQEDTNSASEEETSNESEEAAEETEETESTESEGSQDIDYEKELEKEQQARSEKPQRSRLDKALYKREQLDKEITKLQEGEGGEEEEESHALDESKIRQIIREENASTEAVRQIHSIASNEAEAKLIQFHYENSIVRTGNVQDDIESAWALANKRKVRAQIAEMQRTLLSKETRTKGAGAGQKQASKPQVKLSPQDKKLAQAYGLTPEEIQKSLSK